MRQAEPATQAARRGDARWSVALFAIRYGIGGVMILAGIVVLFAVRGDLGAYGFASAVGTGLSVLLLSFLFRMRAGTATASVRSKREGTSTSTASCLMRKSEPPGISGSFRKEL